MPRRASNLQSTEKGALDSRAEVLLAALIKEHLVTGEAVGSRVLSDRFSHGYGWSPATIRNVMAELEDAGLVEQPHTSAGRVPTDKGYRYYVDNMLGEARLSRTDLKAIDHLFSASDFDAGSSPDRLMETAFGGNPSHITIGGESAGSMSVSALMASPLSRSEIAAAIGESGAMMQKLTPPALAGAERQGAAFAQSIGAPTLAALRAVPADKLLAAQGNAKDMPFDTVIDGYFLTEPPAVTFSSGKAAHVPLLVGSNSQEAPGSAVFGEDPPTVANYRAGLARTLGDKADALFALYPAKTEADVLPIATELASDDFLALPTWKWFDLQRRTRAPTYYYYFTRVRPRFVTDTSGNPLPWGAVHSAEIEYALGNLDTNPLYVWTADDRKVSATMSAYFANFIKAGNPNSRGLPIWPKAALDAGKIRRQVIDVDTHSAPFPQQRRYVAAEPLLYMH